MAAKNVFGLASADGRWAWSRRCGRDVASGEAGGSGVSALQRRQLFAASIGVTFLIAAALVVLIGTRSDAPSIAAGSATRANTATVTSLAAVAATYDQRMIIGDIGDMDTIMAPGSADGPAPAVGPANCAPAGTLSIPAIDVGQSILAESVRFASGLLCGNEDGTTQGVDMLSGFTPIADSVAGGARLQGGVPDAIFGHRNSHNHPFHDIPDLRKGDAVGVDLDGTASRLQVSTLVLLPLAEATKLVLSPSPDGSPMVRLVACVRLDGSPDGTLARWIVTLTPA